MFKSFVSPCGLYGVEYSADLADTSFGIRAHDEVDFVSFEEVGGLCKKGVYVPWIRRTEGHHNGL